jgi:hypothetical protein
MRWLVTAVVAGTGCTSGGGGDGTADTGQAECPAEVHLEATACLETTAQVGSDAGDIEGSVSGVVSELGVPSTLYGSAPVRYFRPCDAVERVIRLVDDAGDTWTVGWAVEGDLDELPDSVPVGAEVRLSYDRYFAGYDIYSSLVIADAGGPRFVFADVGLEPALLEGLAVAFDFSDTCPSVIDGREWDEAPVTFTGASTLVLYSGQSGTVELASGALDVVVPLSARNMDCTDGCGTYEWVGWD